MPPGPQRYIAPTHQSVRSRATAGSRRLLISSLAVISLLLPPAARADVGRDHPTAAAGEPAPRAEPSEQEATEAEIRRFKTASISLRDALGIARERHSGSRAVDASFDGETGVPIYQVRMVRGNRLWETTIDARTGATIKTEVLSAIPDLETHDRELLVRLRAVRQDLPDAIVVAERSTNGRAISAGLMVEQGRLQFVIVCVAGSDLKQVLLEPPVAAGVKR